MGDLILGWAVIILPTLFALGLELVNEEIRKDRRWRWGVIAFGVTLSGLTFWQQSRALTNAKADQEEAIQRTAERVTNDLAPRVAAETSGSVTAVLNQQYGSIMSGLYKEIGKLEGSLQNQSGLRQQELALNFLVSADLVYAGDTLQIWNKGKTTIYFWGDRYGDERSDFAPKPNAIVPTDYYYVLTDKLKAVVLKQLGQNGETRVPFDVYLTSANGKKYIMHNTLWEVVKEGQLTIHTQTHGYEAKDWSKVH